MTDLRGHPASLLISCNRRHTLRRRAIHPTHIRPLEEPAKTQAGAMQSLSPALQSRVVIRLGNRIRGDRVSRDRLRFRHRLKVGKRGVSCRVGAGARKQERGQQG